MCEQLLLLNNRQRINENQPICCSALEQLTILNYVSDYSSFDPKQFCAIKPGKNCITVFKASKLDNEIMV
jgi:hypothetical protein